MCGFKDFNGIYQLKNEWVSLLKMIIERENIYIIMYSNFYIYYEQNMEKSKLTELIITIMFIKIGMNNDEQCSYSIKEKKNKKRSSFLRWLRRDYVD